MFFSPKQPLYHLSMQPKIVFFQGPILLKTGLDTEI